MGVRQSGQPRLWSCTALAHDSQKRWWPHGTSAKRASRGATKQTSQESTVSADTVDVVPAASLLLAAVCGRVRSSSSSVSSSVVAAWLSLIIMSAPTAWLTARKNCILVYLALSNLCKHVLMRLSFIRVTRFLARLMGKPMVTLLTSAWLSKVVCCRWPKKANKFGCATLIHRRRDAWKLSTALLVLAWLSRTDRVAASPITLHTRLLVRTAQTAQTIHSGCGVGVPLSPGSCPESESDSESASKSRTPTPGTRP